MVDLVVFRGGWELGSPVLLARLWAVEPGKQSASRTFSFLKISSFHPKQKAFLPRKLKVSYSL